MNIQIKKLSDLKLADYNPRVHSKAFLEKLEKSMTKFGYVEPIVWNQRTGNVVGGHARIKILKKQGKEEAEVVVVDLDENDEKTLNLALNKVSGEWDEQPLADVLKQLYESKVDLSYTGFADKEINELIKEDYIKEPKQTLHRCPKCGYEW